MKNKTIKLLVIIIITATSILFLSFINIKFKLFAYKKECDCTNIDHTFSVMTFNINAYNSASLTDSLQDGFIRLLSIERPDILCIQELSFKNYAILKPQLDSIYGLNEDFIDENEKWRFRFYSRYHMRNFGKYKCVGEIDLRDMIDEELSEVNVYRNLMNTMSSEFEVVPGRWVTVFSSHLRSSAYSTARRSMDKDASWFDGLSLYKRNYVVGKRIRDYEAMNVRRLITNERESDHSVIVAGDLNDWCGSDCLDALMGDDLKDTWWEGGNGFGWTYFGWHLRLRLDHILYSNELELVEVKVVDSDLSDHKPLIAKFRFKK